MVEVALHIALVALHVCQFIIVTNGQCFFAIAHAMRFQISLSHYIDTILVAQIIPIRVIWIMTSSNAIDIELLHDLNVLHHTFF